MGRRIIDPDPLKTPIYRGFLDIPHSRFIHTPPQIQPPPSTQQNSEKSLQKTPQKFQVLFHFSPKTSQNKLILFKNLLK